MSALELRLDGQLGDFNLTANVSLARCGVAAVFGHSAAGKTTVLRTIAGLQPINHAYIKVGDQLWQDSDQGINIPAHQRAIGYVFQESLLFPHMTARDNIRYGYRRTKLKQIRWDEVVEVLSLDALLNRHPHNLSGGEQKRVALARALLSSPSLLMLDEPLAGLDEAGKQEIMPFLERVHKSLNIPMLYVCHSLSEVMRLADSLILMEKGAVVACGELLQVLNTVERFPSIDGSVLEGVISAHHREHQLSDLVIGDQTIKLGGLQGRVGDRVRIFVNMSDVSISLTRAEHSSILNIIPCQIQHIHDYDEVSCVVVLSMVDAERDNANLLKARITHFSLNRLGLKSGQSVFSQVKSVALVR